jgi:hypothetical protein
VHQLVNKNFDNIKMHGTNVKTDAGCLYCASIILIIVVLIKICPYVAVAFFIAGMGSADRVA